jgi:hypothetical protein
MLLREVESNEVFNSMIGRMVSYCSVTVANNELIIYFTQSYTKITNKFHLVRLISAYFLSHNTIQSTSWVLLNQPAEQALYALASTYWYWARCCWLAETGHTLTLPKDIFTAVCRQLLDPRQSTETYLSVPRNKNPIGEAASILNKNRNRHKSVLHRPSARTQTQEAPHWSLLPSGTTQQRIDGWHSIS